MVEARIRVRIHEKRILRRCERVFGRVFINGGVEGQEIAQHVFEGRIVVDIVEFRALNRRGEGDEIGILSERVIVEAQER